MAKESAAGIEIHLYYFILLQLLSYVIQTSYPTF